MTMYYLMASDTGGEPNVYLKALNNEFVDTYTGTLIDEASVDVPFEFEMDVQKDADGTPETPRMSAYYYAKPLMHQRMIAVLRESGVDNLQLFPAVLHNPDTGESNTEYQMVNVIGVVACASVEDSDAIPFAGGFYFNDLVIDPEKTRGLLCFRLAESDADVLVHESVAKRLLQARLPHLELEPLREQS